MSLNLTVSPSLEAKNNSRAFKLVNAEAHLESHFAWGRCGCPSKNKKSPRAFKVVLSSSVSLCLRSSHSVSL